jgi:long-chain acyl-CoA synthetase
MSDVFSSRGITLHPDRPATVEDIVETIPHLLRRAVDTAPDREALVDASGRMSYAQLWDAATRVAGGLRDQGCRTGDRIAICMPNSASWVVAYFGVLLSGATVVPINVRLAPPEVEFILDDCAVSAVFRDPADLPSGEPFWNTAVHAEDSAAICYTSGTTGRPKGAHLTQANVVAGVELFSRGLEANQVTYEGIRTMISVPLFHAAGLVTQLLPTVRQVGTTIVLGQFTVDDYLDWIERERVESILGVPAILRGVIDSPRFAQTDISSVRSVLYGAAPTPPELIRDLLTAFPTAQLGNGYGMTELSNASFLPHSDAATHPESVGYPTPGTEVRLADVDDQGVGVLMIRGPQVMGGYWNRPEDNKRVLLDGWLRTGDLCRFDDEGRIYIVDREKDMIIRGGENVYSVEVENVLAAINGVTEVAVIGLEDTHWGERVAAMIVTEPDSTITVDDLLRHAAGQLAPYKIPEFVIVRSEPLPRNATGKILKKPIRDTTQWSGVRPVRAPKPTASEVIS